MAVDRAARFLYRKPPGVQPGAPVRVTLPLAQGSYPGRVTHDGVALYERWSQAGIDSLGNGWRTLHSEGFGIGIEWLGHLGYDVGWLEMLETGDGMAVLDGFLYAAHPLASTLVKRLWRGPVAVSPTFGINAKHREGECMVIDSATLWSVSALDLTLPAYPSASMALGDS